MCKYLSSLFGVKLAYIPLAKENSHCQAESQSVGDNDLHKVWIWENRIYEGH